MGLEAHHHHTRYILFIFPLERIFCSTPRTPPSPARSPSSLPAGVGSQRTRPPPATSLVAKSLEVHTSAASEPSKSPHKDMSATVFPTTASRAGCTPLLEDTFLLERQHLASPTAHHHRVTHFEAVDVTDPLWLQGTAYPRNAMSEDTLPDVHPRRKKGSRNRSADRTTSTWVTTTTTTTIEFPSAPVTRPPWPHNTLPSSVAETVGNEPTRQQLLLTAPLHPQPRSEMTVLEDHASVGPSTRSVWMHPNGSTVTNINFTEFSNGLTESVVPPAGRNMSAMPSVLPADLTHSCPSSSPSHSHSLGQPSARCTPPLLGAPANGSNMIRTSLMGPSQYAALGKTSSANCSNRSL